VQGDQLMIILRHVATLPADQDVPAFRHGDPELDPETVALAVPGLRRLDENVAARNSSAELLQPIPLPGDFGTEFLGGLAIAIGNLGRYLHRFASHLRCPDNPLSKDAPMSPWGN